jgi:hypothetical protein
MSYRPLEKPIRGDALSAGYLRALDDNLAFARRMFEAEHLANGEHATYAIPSFIATVTNTSIYGDTAGIAVNESSGAVLAISLPYADFPPNSISITVQPWCISGSLKPRFASATAYQSVDPTRTIIEIYHQQLSSALGAGNTWADAPISTYVSIMVHRIKTKTAFARRQFRLGAGETMRDYNLQDWNGLLYGIDELYGAVRAGHGSTGIHFDRKLAARSAMMRYQSSDYALTYDNSYGISVTDPSAGLARFGYVISPTTSAFFCGDVWSEGEFRGESNAELVCVAPYLETVSPNAFNVARFSFNGTNWSLAHGSSHWALFTFPGA